MIDLVDALAWWSLSVWNRLVGPIVDALDASAARHDRARSAHRARRGHPPDRDDTVWRRPAIPDDHLMGPAEIDAYIDTAFTRHPDAPERVCGAPPPAHERRWCTHPANHLWDTHEYDPEDQQWKHL